MTRCTVAIRLAEAAGIHLGHGSRRVATMLSQAALRVAERHSRAWQDTGHEHGYDEDDDARQW